MYRHLLVTVDDTPGGIDAVGHALELARSLGARVTFVLSGAGSHRYLPEAQASEHGAKVEAAASAQGVSYAIASGGTSLADTARELGCDLICVAAQAAGAAREEGGLDASAVPVLVCPASEASAAARVIARCLDAHRAVTGMLHALLRHGTARGMPGGDGGARRRVLADLAGLQALRRAGGPEPSLFAMLRTRTETVEAELDELDRQQRRDAHALDELARMTQQTMPSADFDAALAAYARGVFEQMGREEGVIFPAARRYLGEADWMELERKAEDGADALLPATDEPEGAQRASD
ncbi:UspA domain-containing protein [Burkholderia multivorans]